VLPATARVAFAAACLERQWPLVSELFSAGTGRGYAALFFRRMLDSAWSWIVGDTDQPAGLRSRCDQFSCREMSDTTGSALHEGLVGAFTNFGVAIDKGGEHFADLRQSAQDIVENMIDLLRRDIVLQLDPDEKWELVKREMARQKDDLTALQKRPEPSTFMELRRSAEGASLLTI
jgi:hypothetical protein